MSDSYEGLIIKGVGGLYTVKIGNEHVACQVRGIFRKKNITPLVGDHVKVEKNTICEILPRKNSLPRPTCANIDKLFIVIALAEPEPDVYNIDKMITISYNHSIEPVLIFNKQDLGDRYGVREIYRNLAVKQIDICATNSDSAGLDAVRHEVEGCTVVLSGVSGVGKSSIRNLLQNDIIMQTGDISRKLRRGKNTTRHVELFDFCGGHIMDTPGFSNLMFEYFELKDRAVLQNCFPEFSDYLGKCRFSDCSHTKEPGCAVASAVVSGSISESRYSSYKLMYEQIGPLKLWEKEKEKGII